MENLGNTIKIINIKSLAAVNDIVYMIENLTLNWKLSETKE
jgi:hypothetical protein